MTMYILSSRLEQFSREPPFSELGHAPWTERKTSLTAFVHLPHAWPQLPLPRTALPHHPSSLPWAGVVQPPPAGSWGLGPRSVQRVLCLGWKQLFSPLWKQGLGLIIKLSETGSKGTVAWGVRISELSSGTADSLSSVSNPCTFSLWAEPV